ncbi:hypothetical protein SVAN01_10848 [Stagonosporopsis vannaccii]|nr:hypothetical protein SVAN01_10848 [Stagonosporopsis vannaccii]
MSTTSTPRSSMSLAKSALVDIAPWQGCAQSTSLPPHSKTSRLWQRVKKHMKEHHESVEAVYANVYGMGSGREQTGGKKQEVWVYERGVYGAR